MNKFKPGDKVAVISNNRVITGKGSYGTVIAYDNEEGEIEIEFEYTTGKRWQNTFYLDEDELDFHDDYILDKKISEL